MLPKHFKDFFEKEFERLSKRDTRDISNFLIGDQIADLIARASKELKKDLEEKEEITVINEKYGDEINSEDLEKEPEEK